MKRLSRTGDGTLPRVAVASVALLALSSVALLTARAQETPKPSAIVRGPIAPSTTETVDTDMMAKIRDEGMNRSQLPQTLAYITDVNGPRLTGSSGLKRAEEWIKGQLTTWGLTNAHLEQWGPFGRGWTLERFSAQAVSPVCIPLIAYPKAWSPGWDGVKTAEVIYLDATDEAGLEKYKGKLKGKFVLISPMRAVQASFNSPDSHRMTDEELGQMAQPPGLGNGRPGGFPGGGRPGGPQGFQFNTRKLQFVMEEGAALMVDAARGEDGTIFVQQATVVPPAGTPPPTPGPGGFGGARIAPWSKEADKRIPAQVSVSIEQYNRLVRMIQAGEKVELALELKVRYEDVDNGMPSNVIAEIPGTDKADEVVMCGGHIDSWHSGTGATDNAAGVSVCMEAVRILKALGAKPRRTIRFACWSGEEQGLFGSRAYVEQHFGKPGALKPEAEKLAGYFNLDNGTGKIRGVYCQGNEAVVPIFGAWLQPFADLGATTLTLRNTGGTDHLSFDAVGIPGFQFIQDPIDYGTRTHHSNQDVFDRIQTDDMKQSAIIMAGFLYTAANRDEKLPHKPVPVAAAR